MRAEHIEFLTDIEERLAALLGTASDDVQQVFCIVMSEAAKTRSAGDTYRIELSLECWPQAEGTRCVISKTGDRFDLASFHEACRAELARLVAKIEAANAAHESK